MSNPDMLYKWGKHAEGKIVRALTTEERAGIARDMARMALRLREWDTVSSRVQEGLATAIADWMVTQSIYNIYRIAHIAYGVDD